jgi:hypothetical protein
MSDSRVYLVTYPATITFSLRASSPEEAQREGDLMVDMEPWSDIDIDILGSPAYAYVGTTGPSTVEEDDQANA